MQSNTTISKQTAKTWIGVENGLKTSRTGNKKVLIPSSTRYDFSISSGFSVQATFTLGTSADDVPFAARNDVDAGRFWNFLFANSKIYFELYNAAGGTIFVEAPVSNVNNKTFYVIASYDPATGKVSLYINGIYVAISAGAITGTFPTVIPLSIGGFYIGTVNGLNGQASNCVIYNKTLTAAEVWQCYNMEIGLVPKSLHANVVGHWTLNHRYGKVAYDSVEQYNYVKETALTANHGELVNYTDAETGVSDKTNAPAWTDHYTKTFVAKINASAIEIKTGLPEITGGLKVDATHTISYPLSGTTQVTLNGYLVQAYKLKAGRTLTTAQLKHLENNGLYANPGGDIKAKLDAYYVFNSIDTTSGNRILDLIGTNHATLTGYTANETSPAHIDYAIKTVKELRYGFDPRDLTSAKVLLWTKATKNLQSGTTIVNLADNTKPITINGTMTVVNDPVKGKPCFNFTGSNNLICNFGRLVAQPTTIVIAKRASAIGGVKFVFDGYEGGNRQVLINYSNNNYISAVNDVNVGPETTNMEVYVIVFNGAASKYSLNGGAFVTFNPGTQGIQGLRIGAQYDNNNKWTGLIPEIDAFEGALSDLELSKINTHFNTEYR